MAPRNDGRLLQPQLPHQDCPRHHTPRLPVQGRHHRSDRLASNSRQLDSESDSQEGHRDQQLLARNHGWWRCCTYNHHYGKKTERNLNTDAR